MRLPGRAGVLPSAPNSDSLLCEWEGELVRSWILELVRSWILTSNGLDHLPHNVSRQDESHIQTSFSSSSIQKSLFSVCVCVCVCVCV